MTQDLEPWNSLTREQFAAHINEMILHDFTGLLNLLYRLDVSETRIRKILDEMPHADAGNIIAGVIIERQLQKAEIKKASRQQGADIPDDEKW